MKKVVIFAAAAALAACTNPNQYVIEGQAGDFEGTLYLYDVEQTPIDSVVVAENGQFRFVGEVEVPAIAYIMSGDNASQQFAMRLFLEPGKITVTTPEEGMPAAAGTPSNDARAAYAELYAKLVEEYRNPETSEERRAEVDAAMDQLTADAYNANVGNIFGASMLQDQSYSLSGAEMLAEIAKFPEAMQANKPLARLKETAEQKAKVDPGQTYIDIVQNDPAGNPVSLKSVIENPANKYVLVDFWASWCGPCMREVPYLVQTYGEFHSKGFEIYGVSFDTDGEKWVAAIKDKKLDWVHVSELQRFNNQAAVDYAVNAIPTNYLVNTADGTIVARNLRGEDVYARISELLAE